MKSPHSNPLPLRSLAFLCWTAAAMVLACVPRSATALDGIKGSDDRREVLSRQYPWSTVGRLNNGLGGHCSGVLIGPKVVATAAHCLWNRKTLRPIAPSSLHFVAGYNRGAYLSTSAVQSYSLSPNWRFSAPYDGTMIAADWALLTLEHDLGSQIGWVAVGTSPQIGDKIIAVGYGQDKAHVPMAHIGCVVTGQLPSGAFTNDCDAVKGDSGAPIFAQDARPFRKTPNESTAPLPRLAALHVATLKTTIGSAGGAVGVTSFATEALRLGAGKTSFIGPLSTQTD